MNDLDPETLEVSEIGTGPNEDPDGFPPFQEAEGDGRTDKAGGPRYKIHHPSLHLLPSFQLQIADCRLKNGSILPTSEIRNPKSPISRWGGGGVPPNPTTVKD